MALVLNLQLGLDCFVCVGDFDTENTFCLPVSSLGVRHQKYRVVFDTRSMQPDMKDPREKDLAYHVIDYISTL